MEPASRELRVLAVEDSAISRKLIEYALASPEYKVEFAKDGKEAVARFEKGTPDLLVTDWELPDTTGVELCKRIRASGSNGYTYVLLVTGNSDKKSLAAGLASGADDYITKPFDQVEFRARIDVGRRIVQMHRDIEAKAARLAMESRTDPLSGLPNRRAIEEWSAKQLAGAIRHGYALWIVVAELETHRVVNDLFGREAGDATIRGFAEVLKKNTRTSDLCGHLGGAHFALVVTHVEDDKIQLVVDRLRGQLAERPCMVEGSPTPLIATFGLATYNGTGQLELPELMRQADASLLQAKRAANAQPVGARPTATVRS